MKLMTNHATGDGSKIGISPEAGDSYSPCLRGNFWEILWIEPPKVVWKQTWNMMGYTVLPINVDPAPAVVTLLSSKRMDGRFWG